MPNPDDRFKGDRPPTSRNDLRKTIVADLNRFIAQGGGRPPFDGEIKKEDSEAEEELLRFINENFGKFTFAQVIAILDYLNDFSCGHGKYEGYDRLLTGTEPEASIRKQIRNLLLAQNEEIDDKEWLTTYERLAGRVFGVMGLYNMTSQNNSITRELERLQSNYKIIREQLEKIAL